MSAAPRRAPAGLTPQAIITAIETTRPSTRTFWYRASIQRKGHSSARGRALKSSTCESSSLLNSETWGAEIFSMPVAWAPACGFCWTYFCFNLFSRSLT